MFQIFPSLKKVKVGSPKHLISNFGSKPTTKLLNPMILFASFYMSRTVWNMFGNIRLSSIFSIIELCRSMGQHFREHFCEGGYPHLTEEYMIRRHIHSK